MECTGENIVKISGVFGETKPIKLTSGYSNIETGDIPVNETISYSPLRMLESVALTLDMF